MFSSCRSATCQPQPQSMMMVRVRNHSPSAAATTTILISLCRPGTSRRCANPQRYTAPWLGHYRHHCTHLWYATTHHTYTHNPRNNVYLITSGEAGIEALKHTLGHDVLALPEQLFGGSSVVLTHPATSTTLRFDARGALHGACLLGDGQVVNVCVVAAGANNLLCVCLCVHPTSMA